MMGSLTAWWLAILLLLITVEGHAKSKEVSRGMQVEINQQGFDLIATELKESVFSEYKSGHIAKIQKELSSSTQLTAKNISYQIDFGDLSVEPHPGALKLHMKLDMLNFHVAKVNLVKKIIWDWTFKCSNLYLTSKDDQQIDVDVLIPISLDGEGVRLNKQDMSLEIASNQLSTRGPSSCSIGIFKSFFLNALTRVALFHLKKNVNSVVKGFLVSYLPDIERLINESLTKAVKFNLTNIPGIPPSRIILQPRPEFLTINDNHLAMEFAIKICREGVEPAELGFVKEDEVSAMTFGRIGLNPQVISSFISLLNPGEYVEIDEELIPVIYEVLASHRLAAIWPELNELELDSPHLRLFLKMKNAPDLIVDDQEQSTSAEMRELELLWQVQLDGEWQDFFVTHLDVIAIADIFIEDSSLKVHLKPETMMEIYGDWADGYDPFIDIFDVEIAEFVISSLIDYLVVAGPLVDFDIPSLLFGGEVLSLGEISMEMPYVFAKVEPFAEALESRQQQNEARERLK